MAHRHSPDNERLPIVCNYKHATIKYSKARAEMTGEEAPELAVGQLEGLCKEAAGDLLSQVIICSADGATGRREHDTWRGVVI